MESAVFVQISGRKLQLGPRRCDALPKAVLLRDFVRHAGGGKLDDAVSAIHGIGTCPDAVRCAAW
jgi:hypothetical protein